LGIVFEKNEKISEIEDVLLENGYVKSQNMREIFNAVKNAEKTFFALGETAGKNIYNLLIQYPTGQIVLNDGVKNLVANPNYQEGNIVVLVNKKDIKKIEQDGKNILSIFGLTLNI
jgi:uncharacterized protein (UPF0333 family)